MSLLTQFYPGPGGGGGGVGTYPGVYASDPSSPNVSPVLFLGAATSVAVNFSCPNPYQTVTFNAARIDNTAGGSLNGAMTKIVDLSFKLAAGASSINYTVTLNPNLTTIDGLWWETSVTAGTSTLSVNIKDNSSLTTISRIYQLVTGSVTVGRTIIYDFSGNALSQASVDALLVAINAGKGTGTGTRQVDLSGGTNSTPGAAGLAAKASLVAAGWVVTNN